MCLYDELTKAAEQNEERCQLQTVELGVHLWDEGLSRRADNS